MLNIADVIYHGIAFDPKNWNRDAMAQEIAAASNRLFDALEREGIPFTLVGGLAMLSHIEGRNTRDLDIIVSLEDLGRIAGIEVREGNEWFAVANYSGLRVDILKPECPVFKLVHQRFSEPRQFEQRMVRTATKEGLMLLKLFALSAYYRNFQIEKIAMCEGDITSLIHKGCTNSSELLTLLKPHMVPEEFAEMEDILRGLKVKYAAFAKKAGPTNRPSPPA